MSDEHSSDPLTAESAPVAAGEVQAPDPSGHQAPAGVPQPSPQPNPDFRPEASGDPGATREEPVSEVSDYSLDAPAPKPPALPAEFYNDPLAAHGATDANTSTGIDADADVQPHAEPAFPEQPSGSEAQVVEPASPVKPEGVAEPERAQKTGGDLDFAQDAVPLKAHEIPGADEAALVSALSPSQEQPESRELTSNTEPPTTSVADTGFLVELVLPTITPTDTAPEPGDVLDWGGARLTLTGALPDGWLEGAFDDGARGGARPGADGALWADLPAHRALPHIVHASSAGVMVALSGEPVLDTLSPSEALKAVLPAAQLLRFLESRGLAAVELSRASLRKLPEERWVMLPPRLARIGEPAPAVYTPGYTPLELLNRGEAIASVGVMLLAATLYHLLKGEPLPEEGADSAVLGALNVPGWPQLLTDALSEPNARLQPEQFLGRLRAMLDQPPLRLVATGFSTVGLNPTRPVNEDSYGYRLNDVTVYPTATRTLQAVVSDGMGGMAAGEVASRAAVETFLAEGAPANLGVAAQAEWTLARAWAANKAVLEALSGQNGGCTFSGLVAIGDRVTLAHVGDTRAYLWRDGQLRQITKDHSWVALMVASGNMLPAEAEVSDQRSLLVRSMGSVSEPRADYIDTFEASLGEPSLRVKRGDLLLLVSDGVWGEAPSSLLEALVAGNHENPRELVRALVNAALEAGAPDNATALAVTVE